MGIIQSYAQFDEGNPYLKEKGIKDDSKKYLNFYSFLLSYATLKHFYGGVVMYCNQKAFDTFVKYIPYDFIIIKENRHDFDFWNLYKIDMMKESNQDEVIHVDCDVFLHNDLFIEFIQNKGDILVQDIVPKEENIVLDFVPNNKKYLAEKKIFTKEYDGKYTSCGVIGLKKHVKEKFFEAVEIISNDLKQFKKDNGLPMHKQIIIMEELLLYLVAVENNFKILDILPHDLILKHGHENVGDMVGYVHLWRGHKYLEDNIIKMRNAIQLNYTEYYQYILEYEEKVLKPLNITI